MVSQSSKLWTGFGGGCAYWAHVKTLCTIFFLNKSCIMCKTWKECIPGPEQVVDMTFGWMKDAMSLEYSFHQSKYRIDWKELQGTWGRLPDRIRRVRIIPIGATFRVSLPVGDRRRSLFVAWSGVDSSVFGTSEQSNRRLTTETYI